VQGGIKSERVTKEVCLNRGIKKGKEGKRKRRSRSQGSTILSKNLWGTKLTVVLKKRGKWKTRKGKAEFGQKEEGEEKQQEKVKKNHVGDDNSNHGANLKRILSRKKKGNGRRGDREIKSVLESNSGEQ